MARFLTALALLAVASTAVAFCPSRSSFFRTARLGLATEDTDFDAPIPAYPQSGTATLDHEPIVDDECYMGKDGQADECVDFDPPRRLTRSFNAMDQPRLAPKWAFGDDFDAPVPANPQSGTYVLDGEPVVDDECYMGKDGQADECVDFDPPRRMSDWDNSMDKIRHKSPLLK